MIEQDDPAGVLVASLIIGVFVGVAGGLLVQWQGAFVGGYGWVWGLGMGVVASVCGSIPALRRYRSALQRIRSGLRTALPASVLPAAGEVERGSRVERIERDIDRLSSRLERYDHYVQLARELVQQDGSGASIDDEVLDRLRDHLTSLNERMSNLDHLQEEFNRDVRPIFEKRLDPIRLEGVVDFQGLIGFQADIEEHFSTAEEALSELDETLETLDSIPDQIRDQIEQANRVLLELAEVFRHFPARDLVDSAEQLRRQTLDWDAMAGETGKRLNGLQETVEASRRALDNIRSEAARKPDAEETWDRVKKELARVDEKVRQIQRATDPEWIKRLDEELELIRSRAGSIAGSIRDLVDDLESRRQQRRRHHQILRDLADETMS